MEHPPTPGCQWSQPNKIQPLLVGASLASRQPVLVKRHPRAVPKITHVWLILFVCFGGWIYGFRDLVICFGGQISNFWALNHVESTFCKYTVWLSWIGSNPFVFHDWGPFFGQKNNFDVASIFQTDVARALARFLEIFAAQHAGSRRLVLAGECSTGAAVAWRVIQHGPVNWYKWGSNKVGYATIYTPI